MQLETMTVEIPPPPPGAVSRELAWAGPRRTQVVERAGPASGGPVRIPLPDARLRERHAPTVFWLRWLDGHGSAIASHRLGTAQALHARSGGMRSREQVANVERLRLASGNGSDSAAAVNDAGTGPKAPDARLLADAAIRALETGDFDGCIDPKLRGVLAQMGLAGSAGINWSEAVRLLNSGERRS